MVDFDLRFDVPEHGLETVAPSTFFWPPTGNGSFRTPLGPSLGELGPVKPANADLVRIAATVYAADRSVPRRVGRVNWSERSFRLRVPVSDPDVWASLASDLQAMLAFLSGDRWELDFARAQLPKEPASQDPWPKIARVVLQSGGADSAVGAFLARTENAEHTLVSHVGATSIAPIQRDVAKLITDLVPGGPAQHHKQVIFTRTGKQPGGLELKNEYSTRTRSFLFLALGLAVASVRGVPLWIPENGFASLNPPLGADQLGSLSTRTTHPWFLAELSRLAQTAGAHGDLSNPFFDKTKGEMFRWVADTLGSDEGASTFLSLTNSCAYTNRRFDGVPPSQHCGVCFGCLMRRASFLAAGLTDRSSYVVDAPPNETVADRLARASVMPSIAAFVTRGISVGDIAAMRLPQDYLPSSARALCERGKAELEFLL